MRRFPLNRSLSSRRDAGFTLIELIVSLILLATLMALMPSTLTLSKRAWETAFALGSRPDRTAILSFVEQRLSEALPLLETDVDGNSGIAFLGTAQSIRFVAPLSNGPHGGGVYRMELGLRSIDDATRAFLGLRLVPFSRSTAVASAPAAIYDRRLIEGVEAVQFRYFGAATPSDNAIWSSEWSSANRLPELVELQIVMQDSEKKPAQTLRVELRLRSRA